MLEKPRQVSVQIPYNSCMYITALAHLEMENSKALIISFS